MAKQKKPRVKRKSDPTDIDREAEARALAEWLRMVDKPQGRGAKKRGNNK